MFYMNDFDISNASQRYTSGVRAQAIKILQAHVDVVNSNSDGWTYWKPPVAAARKLMELIMGPPSISEVTAAECLKLALRPIKAFYTKHPMLPRPVLLDCAIVAENDTRRIDPNWPNQT
jgi:hypothetical protein